MTAATLPPLYNGGAYAPSLHSCEQAARKRSREPHRATEDVQFIPWGDHEGYGLHRVSVCPHGFRWKCSYYLGGLGGLTLNQTTVFRGWQ